MTDIKYFFDHQECPGINGIYFPDGTAQLLDVIENRFDGKRYSVRLREKTSINELKKNKILDCWNDCAILCNKVYNSLNIEVMSGESDYGDDGFVAVVSHKSHELIWLVFLDCSNPFNKVSVKEDAVYAESTSGACWMFPLSSPADVKVKEIKSIV